MEKFTHRDTHTAFHSELIKQFGGQLSFPGIKVDGQFVSLEQGDLERVQAYGEYWLDELMLFANEEESCGSSGSERNNPHCKTKANCIQPSSDSSFDWATTKANGPTGPSAAAAAANHSTMRGRQLRQLSLGSINTGVSELSSASSVFRDICLPNGMVLTPSEMTRKLLAVVQHSIFVEHGKPWYYFRGMQAISILTELFFKDKEMAVSEHDALALCQQLGTCCPFAR